MNQKGQTLIEVVIGVVLLAVVFTGLFQALAVGIWGTWRVDQRTTAQQIAASEIEYIKSQDYNEEAPYQYDLITLDDPPIVIEASPDTEYPVSGFNVTYSIAEIVEKVLQQITMTVVHRGGESVQLTGYKANVEYGMVPQCTETVSKLKNLNDDWGYYYEIDTGDEGPISAYWAISKEEAIEIYIYEGTPFELGLGGAGSDEGTSNTDPDTLADYLVGMGAGTFGDALAVTWSWVEDGDYTVYFFNASASGINTDSARVSYTCED